MSICGAGWLFFLPNASYLITEFVHAFRYFRPASGPFWLEAKFWCILFTPLTAALTGLFLFSVSLNIVQMLLKRAHGALFGWLCVLLILLLSSFGVYIGRFVRWNSWDVLLRPGTVAEGIFLLWTDAAQLAQMLPFLILVFMITGVFYLWVYQLAQ